MTNLERILERRRQLVEEFMQWLLQPEEDRITDPDPVWCDGQHCEDTDGDCRECFTKWLYEEVRMTNFEKWKKNLAETKDSHELIETIGKMYDTRNEWCHKVHNIPGTICTINSDCKVCFEEWLNKEVEE